VIAPDLLLMDEPFVSLDEPTAQRLRMLLVGIWKDRPTTVVFVTHNLREVIQLADRMIVLSHAPGGIRVEIPISLSRVARDNPHAIEGFRHQLVSSHPKLFQGL
jgi:NitT/TauT family transport system ATP-binding protein